MQHLLEKSFTPFMLFAALFTMSAGVLVIAPQFISTLFLLPFQAEYQLLIQHWGLTTFMLGLLLLLCIKIKLWRVPVMLIVLVEKIYMVLLFISLPDAYVAGFQNVAIVDTLISLYFLIYLLNEKKLLTPSS